jgi:hypothetical protein
MYLSWRARQLGSGSRFITLTREVNAAMSAYVVQRVQNLVHEQGKAVGGHGSWRTPSWVSTEVDWVSRPAVRQSAENPATIASPPR